MSDVCWNERQLFERQLKSFVPPNSYDAHAHLCRQQDAISGLPMSSHSQNGDTGWREYCLDNEAWMGDLRPTGGLFFTIPKPDLEIVGANQFVLDQMQGESRALLMIRPGDKPDEVEEILDRDPYVGFKVYHVYASRKDTLNALPAEFIPEWAWELANQRGLAIMFHMVCDRAISEAINQEYIVDRCRRYPNAKLILAHAARGFCGRHTTDGIDSLRGLDNVYFDTSAICEAEPFEAIFKAFGTRRLMFGTDYSVSEIIGRCVSIGDGFVWLGEKNVEWESAQFANPIRVGVESLLALKRACQTQRLNDGDVERLFSHNVREMLGIDNSPSTDKTQDLYRHAKQIIPGGTQLLSKRPEMFAPDVWPGYYEEARGCELYDLDGNCFVDMGIFGIGSCLLGYADPDVTAAVVRNVQMGSMSTLNSPEEVELANVLTTLHPWADSVRYCRSGGESMAIAIRIARASTGRDEIAFCGYHGWSDWYLATNLPHSDSEGTEQLEGHLLPGLEPKGVPTGLAGTTHPFTYNKIDELREIVKQRGDQLAAIVMEPTRSIDPDPGFLEAIRELADECGAVFIFDEISSGWRYHLGGAHLKYGVDPDVAVFAKAIGNGHPMAAIIGRKEVMSAAEASFISSTYWTEGIGPTAALATIKKMQNNDVVAHVGSIGDAVRAGWKQLGADHSLPVKTSGHSAMLHVGFDHAQALELGTWLTTQMLEKGFLTSGGFYPSWAHTQRHVEKYLAALDGVFGEMAKLIKSDSDISKHLKGPVRHTGFARLNTD